MRIVHEVRDGDINVRAGVIVTDGHLMLACEPTNMIRNGWLWDIPKGHLQNGESPMQGAIRECLEETNIKFEPWKLTNPIQVLCDGQPLFLFLALINGLMPLEKLSCASTFVDSFDGIRKPEVEAYAYLNPRTQLHLLQERLRPGVQYYFDTVLHESAAEKTSEDCQIAGGMMGNLPPNIGSTLSLGYKNGRVLPPPKRIAKAQDFSEIPIL
jgi:8-oxo-dGTP pyrophosphatase MutT (NUDIX family)